MTGTHSSDVRAGTDWVHPFHLTWRRGLFLHWPVDPTALRPHVPDPLSLDTRDGTAYLGVLPFVAADVRPRGVPSVIGRRFAELNVRTYVRWNDRPGVFFFTIDVGSRVLAELGNRLSALPVRYAPMTVRRRGESTIFAHEGPDRHDTDLEVTYEPTGPPAPPEPDSLENWLFERYRLYHPTAGRVVVASVRHEPWPVQPASASIRRQAVLESLDLPDPSKEPHVHYADRHGLAASLPHRMSRYSPSPREP